MLFLKIKGSQPAAAPTLINLLPSNPAGAELARETGVSAGLCAG
jgi:hypothetical protein